jgi:hypothetical protein
VKRILVQERNAAEQLASAFPTAAAASLAAQGVAA